MDQRMKLILTIDKVHTAPQRVLDCGPGLGELNQVLWAQPSHSLCLGYMWQVYNIFTRCTIWNQHDILKTAIADVSKG